MSGFNDDKAQAVQILTSMLLREIRADDIESRHPSSSPDASDDLLALHQRRIEALREIRASLEDLV